jgi:hypothetical protein
MVHGGWRGRERRAAAGRVGGGSKGWDCFARIPNIGSHISNSLLENTEGNNYAKVPYLNFKILQHPIDASSPAARQNVKSKPFIMHQTILIYLVFSFNKTGHL